MSAGYTYYDLLGIHSSASAAQIKEAYRVAIRQYHPDVNHAPNATQLLGMMNQAWEILGDPHRRLEYDISIGVRPRSQWGPASNSVYSTRVATPRRIHPALYVIGGVLVLAFWHYILIGGVVYGLIYLYRSRKR